MPPKITYQKKDIIEAAFRLVEKKGLEKLTARQVARELHASTAPVYRYFNSMKELEHEVIQKAKHILLRYATTSHVENEVFLSMGTGTILFARDHGELFRALFMEKDDFKEVVEELLGVLKEEMKKDPRLSKMSDEQREKLLKKMWFFTHGVASLICVGILEQNSKAFIVETLQETGYAIITEALRQSGLA
jgi:AcrR family transcriptional regulator